MKDTSAFVLNLNKNQAKHCTWTVEAPENKHVVVFNIQNVLTFDEESQDKEYEQAFDAALNLSIYDGAKVKASKRLFRYVSKHILFSSIFKTFELILKYCFYSVDDVSLHAVSSGRKLTIDVDYKKPSVYKSREIIVRFGFI